MPPGLPIETDRLIIRPFQERDIEPSYQINLDPEVSRFTGDGGVVDRAEVRRRIIENVFGDYNKYGYGRLAVVWKETGTFIGFSGLKYLEEMGATDLGYRFARAYWGKGIATEAGQAVLDYGRDVLKLNMVIGLVLPENAASVRVLEKLDFLYETKFRDDGFLVHQYELSWD